jgi:DnaJ-class molecular chaperone
MAEKDCERCYGDGVDSDGEECQRCQGHGSYDYSHQAGLDGEDNDF